MSSNGGHTGEAPGQAAGYLYQVRYALYRALRRLLRDPTCTIGVESLDDVSLQSHMRAPELSQLKHTTDDDKEFSDASPAIWRAIRNWINTIESQKLDIASLELILVTNASLSSTSGLAKLGIDETARDVDAALVALKDAATTSAN